MSQRDAKFDDHDDLDDFIAEATASDHAFASAHERAGNRSGLLRAMVAWRKRTKRSQVAVAKAMGTTQSAVSDLEGGASDPRFSTLDRYANAIGCRLQIELVTVAGERLYVTPRPWRALPQTAFISGAHTGINFDPDVWRNLLERLSAADVSQPLWVESAFAEAIPESPARSDNYALAA